MKKSIYIIFFLIGNYCTLLAQPGQNPYWERKGITAFNLSQASLSSWSAGGESCPGTRCPAELFR